MYGTVHSDRGSEAPETLIGREKPYTAFDIVAVAASAGGLAPLELFLSGLPFCFPAPVLVVQHLASRRIYASCLDAVLQRKTKLQVKWAEDGELPRPGHVYLAPQDHVTILDPYDGAIRLIAEVPFGRPRPLADPLFRSAARVFGPRAIAVVLSGMLADGAEGAWQIARAGGRVLAQSYCTAEYADMPRAAIMRSRIGLAFDPCALAHAVVSLVMAPGAAEWFRVGVGHGALSYA
jgi:two-component system chemotaxis response regulator CheB